MNQISTAVGAWVVFFMAAAVGDFEPWAWMLWVPWLGFVTVMAVHSACKR